MNWTDELARLHALHQRAALTDDEYRLAKRRLLCEPSAVEGLRSNINGLRRARGGRWLAGVCAGLAESTGMAPWAWRLGFALLMLFGGAGALAYLLLWIFVPAE
jgi:phage shock protein PspC (stress-responsive transcriptional regulator)